MLITCQVNPSIVINLLWKWSLGAASLDLNLVQAILYSVARIFTFKCHIFCNDYTEWGRGLDCGGNSGGGG